MHINKTAPNKYVDVDLQSKYMINLIKKSIALVGSFTSLIILDSIYANPTNGSVASGNVVIQQTPGNTTIKQTSGRGIINWQSFNIGNGEVTHFNQPIGGVTLNRISPLQGASQIYGRLTATGQVILINPAGVYFGPGAYVNVGGLIVSTANLKDKDFLAGNYHFVQDPLYNGAVVNQGTIIAANNGLVALMGNAVQNDGTIQANLGHAILGSGREFSLSFAGNDKISFTVNSPSTSRAVDKDGNSIADGVKNSGKIIANGGQVLVTANAASGVLDNVINMRGFVEAKSASALPGGGVILNGSGGDVRVAANINVSGTNAKGSNVTIEAPQIIIESPTLINANGDIGGGQITIGRTSLNTSLESGAALLARSLVNGDGGLIETSGKKLTFIDIKVDAGSANGKAGTWLLDPDDFLVSATNVGSILTPLNAGTNVKIETTASGTGGNGDIFLRTNIVWAGASTFTVSAYRNIQLQTGNTFGGTNSNSAFVLRANNAGDFATGNGDVLQQGTINSAGPVTIYYNAATSALNAKTYTNSGSGPLTAYLLINNASQLNTIRSSSSHWAKNLALADNINANNLNSFTPIGNTTTAFTGKFDGLGHYITFLTINGATNNTGLFGVTGAAAVISNLTLYDALVTGTTNVGAIVGNNAGLVNNVYSISGKVTGTGSNVGGIVGINTGTVRNAVNLSVVTAPNASGVGGVVGRSNAGLVDKVLSVGLVQGNTNIGGVIGVNGATVSNSFWDTSTTGRSAGFGSNTGTFNATAGCLTGTCANGGSANLSSASTYSNAGWDTINTWGIIPGNVFYPYLLAQFPSTPQVVSGNIGSFTSYYSNPAWPSMSQSAMSPLWNSYTRSATANQKVNLYVQGTFGDTAFSNADGSFYYLHTPNFYSTSAVLLALSNSSLRGNTIINMPDAASRGTSVTNVPIALNSLVLAGNGVNNDTHLIAGGPGYLIDKFYANLSTTQINTVLGSLTGSNFLFTTSGNNISVKDGFNIVSSPDVNFRMQGNVSTTNGSFSNYGLLTLVNPTSTGNFSITTNSSGNMYFNILNWSSGSVSTPNLYTLNLNAANNIYFADQILGSLRDSNLNLLVGGTLNLFAAFTNQSITTAPSTGIFLFNFNLAKGKWYQTDVRTFRQSGQNNRFNIENSFSINSGVMPYEQAEFIRVGGGDGSVANPYQIVDEYGLQGIGSNSSTLSKAWTATSNTGFAFNRVLRWNNGAGLVPIGTLSQPFTGIFDGKNNEFLFGLVINRPTEDYVGVFGVTSPTAEIKNLRISNSLIQGHNNVGLVGYNQGTILNSSLNQDAIIGNNNVGIFAGTNSGTIKNVATFSNREIGNINVGGTVGVNSGLLDSAVIAHYIQGSSIVGGLAGVNTGTLKNSFWDTAVTGIKKAAGVNAGTLLKVYGGCSNSFFCQNGGTVNLLNPKTYLTSADGGLGLVTNSFDFNNTWNIISGYSYPFIDAQFNDASRVISGKIYPAKANELIALFTNIKPGNRFSVTIATAFDTLFTGADGSFYDLTKISSGSPVVLAATGSDIIGSISFIAPESIAYFKNNGSVSNLAINVINSGNPSTNNLALNYETALGLFEGYSVAETNSLLNPFNAVSFRSFVSPILTYQQALSWFYANSINNLNYYYIYSGGNIIKVYKDVDANIRDLMVGEQARDRQFLNSYDITKIAGPLCKI